MIPPIFKILLSRPALLGEHVAGYAQLARAETLEVVQAWRTQAVMWAVAGVLAVLALLFLGIALIVFAAVPEGQTMSRGWLLWLVPALPAVGAVVAFMMAKGVARPPAYAGLRAQLDADQELMHRLAGSNV